MGTFYVDVEIGDPDGREFVVVNALVDTGAAHTSLPEVLLRQLGVQPRVERLLRLADGRVMRRPLGATMLRLAGEEWSVPVIFASEDAQPLLGATSLQAFGLVVDTDGERLIPADALPW